MRGLAVFAIWVGLAALLAAALLYGGMVASGGAPLPGGTVTGEWVCSNGQPIDTGCGVKPVTAVFPGEHGPVTVTIPAGRR